MIGISPDIKLMEMAKLKHAECDSILQISSFEDYSSIKPFDLILFQESSQYIKDITFLFSHCKELLNNKGYVLLCDEVCYENSKHCFYHQKSEMLSAAHKLCFSVDGAQKRHI